MTGIINELMTFILDTWRLIIQVSCEKRVQLQLLMYQSPWKKRPWESDPTPLEIASSWTLFPLEFLMPSMEGGGGEYKLHPGMEGSIFPFSHEHMQVQQQ